MHLAHNTFKRREKKLLVDEALLPEIKEKLLVHLDSDPHNIENGTIPEQMNYYGAFDDIFTICFQGKITRDDFKAEPFRFCFFLQTGICRCV